MLVTFDSEIWNRKNEDFFLGACCNVRNEFDATTLRGLAFYCYYLKQKSHWRFGGTSFSLADLFPVWRSTTPRLDTRWRHLDLSDHTQVFVIPSPLALLNEGSSFQGDTESRVPLFFFFEMRISNLE